MSPDQIRAAVSLLDTDSTEVEQAAWTDLKCLGAEVVPYLLEAYPRFRKRLGRVSLVYHATRYARIREEAYRLGLKALNDRATMVRYEACGLLAYSLRAEAIEHLRPLLSHSDPRTVEDAVAAMDALRHQNHNYFRDRERSGRVLWVVNDSDPGAIA